MEKQKFKARFSTRLPSGDFLGVTVWPGKSDPTAEVVTVQVRRQTGDAWETVGRIALYRTADGKYSLLPERAPVAETPKAEPIEIGPSGESNEQGPEGEDARLLPSSHIPGKRV